MTKYRLRVANGVIETKENVPFHILFRNLSDQSRQIPKKAVLSNVSPNPVSIVTLPERIFNKVEIFL